MHFILFVNGKKYEHADIFPLWCCVNPHLKAPEHQSAKTSALIEMVTTAADQLFKCI